MTSVMHRAAELPDGRTIPAMHTRPNDPAGKVATIGYWDDDKGFVIVAEEVGGEYAPMLAQASTLYYGLTESARQVHQLAGHDGADFRNCPMTICTRAACMLLGADRLGPLE